jgi:hypothetical protein
MKAGIERERGRGNGSFPVAELTNRLVRGSELLKSGERRSLPGEATKILV